MKNALATLAALLLTGSALSAQVIEIHTPQPILVQPQPAPAAAVTVQTIPAAAVTVQTQQPIVVNAPQPYASFESPIGFGLFPPIQFPPTNASVAGLRLSILAAKNANVGFLDLQPLVGITDGDFTGIAIAGLWNKVGRNASALQIGGLLNTVDGAFAGLQIAGIANVNSNDFSTDALQIACFNRAGGISGGVQLGVLNLAKHWSGLQLGVINVAENLNGLQIGLANIIRQSHVPFMLILNASF